MEAERTHTGIELRSGVKLATGRAHVLILPLRRFRIEPLELVLHVPLQLQTGAVAGTVTDETSAEPDSVFRADPLKLTLHIPARLRIQDSD